MSADNFLYHGVPLSTILEAGTDTLTGVYNVGVNATQMAFRVTGFANNKPLTIPYQYQGANVISASYAAKHVNYNTLVADWTLIPKPSGANALRFIITGGGGGGGGGSGGAWEGAGENHATKGFRGDAGAQGGVLYSIGDIPISGININHYIGAGGAGGTAGAGVVGSNANNHNVYSGAGGTGGTGGWSGIYVGATRYDVTGGAGGGGGLVQYANSSLGWNESFSGAATASLNTDGTTNDAYGNTTYGNTEERSTTSGNIRLTNGSAAINAAVTNNTNWDNSISSTISYGGSGGSGGWGYTLTDNTGGANAGNVGSVGNNGQVTIIWLY